MNKTMFGIDLIKEKKYTQLFEGNVALLAHSSSFDFQLIHSAEIIKEVIGPRLVKLFGPQHGFVTDVQDNMVETADFIHPYFKIPVHSLYGEVRGPTDKMLEDVDTFVIDLQDVGTRVYTYIHTMSNVLKKCGEKNIKVIVLDRPNPIGGEVIEGNILRPEFKSFVGLHPIPMRHGLTMAEMAKLINTHFLEQACELSVVPMKNWNRQNYWSDLNRPWILPSPNLPTPEGALTFVGTVLFEGTNISEGRGTTRSLEFIGHPKLEAFTISRYLNQVLKKINQNSMITRPQVFLPTFQKYKNEVCQGIQLHVLNQQTARPWQVGQIICRELKNILNDDFSWSEKPYEYEFSGLAIDYINGSDEIRKWVNSNGSLERLVEIEQQGLCNYKEKIKTIQLY